MAGDTGHDLNPILSDTKAPSHQLDRLALIQQLAGSARQIHHRRPI